jgi:hypothetical protein
LGCTASHRERERERDYSAVRLNRCRYTSRQDTPGLKNPIQKRHSTNEAGGPVPSFARPKRNEQHSAGFQLLFQWRRNSSAHIWYIGTRRDRPRDPILVDRQNKLLCSSL